MFCFLLMYIFIVPYNVRSGFMETIIQLFTLTSSRYLPTEAKRVFFGMSKALLIVYKDLNISESISRSTYFHPLTTYFHNIPPTT